MFFLESILHRMEKFSFSKSFDPEYMYPTNYDAVHHIKNQFVSNNAIGDEVLALNFKF